MKRKLPVIFQEMDKMNVYLFVFVGFGFVHAIKQEEKETAKSLRGRGEGEGEEQRLDAKRAGGPRVLLNEVRERSRA
jgi:hypothetical protein